jgi:hypothetical protein
MEEFLIIDDRLKLLRQHCEKKMTSFSWPVDMTISAAESGCLWSIEQAVLP